MNNGLATIESAGVEIDHEAILKSLKLNPRDPATQALLVVCDRYQLDPLLKHLVLITGTVYITRDGYLAVAHRSGQFDGMEVLEQGETNTHYTAKVAVYRKDMSRPFAFSGRFPKNKPMAKEYGPEMAVKVAEVQALRRAFNVTGVPAADERFDVELPPDERPSVPPPPRIPPPAVDTETGEVVTKRRPPPTKAEEPFALPLEDAVPLATDDQLAEVIEVLSLLPAERRDALRAAWTKEGIASVTQPERFTADDYERAMALLGAFMQADTAPFV